MLNPSASPPPESGPNWAWLGTIIAGVITGIQAYMHRRRRKHIPVEIFNQLEELEELNKQRVRAENRMWGEIKSLQSDVESLRRETATRSDLKDMERQLMRAVQDSKR